jgi:two-component system, NarL family, response regulator LiaR
MTDKIKILIADDHPTFRDGLRRILEDEEDFDIVGTACDGVEAVALAKKLEPDIVLIDINMPRLRGAEAAKEIRKCCPEAAIIMLSAFDYEAYIVASLQSGARGYLLKSTSVDKLTSSIRLVYRGESVLDIKATDKLVKRLQPQGEEPATKSAQFQRLYKRELQVLELAARGMSNKEIASELGISERTVQTHLVNIFKKLGATSRTQAVLYALKEGWVTLDAGDREPRA